MQKNEQSLSDELRSILHSRGVPKDVEIDEELLQRFIADEVQEEDFEVLARLARTAVQPRSL